MVDQTGRAVRGIEVVSVPVSDQDRARDFYCQMLGFEEIANEQLHPGMRWLQLRPTGGAPTLTLVTWFETMPAGSLRGLVLAVDDVEAAREHLVNHGHQPSAIDSQSWGTYFTVDDPDGNGLVIQRTTPGAGAGPVA